jgi:serine/threonine protein kinase
MENFELIKKLGKGAFGTVWLAEDNNSKLFAIKIYKEEEKKDKLDKIERSFKIGKKIKHPNLMKCYDFFIDRIVTEDNMQRGFSTINNFLVMEYIKGKEINKIENLSNKIEKYLFQIVSALKYLHKNNIIHRDIKPANILISENDEVKIVDYDFLRCIKTKISSKAGTPFYFSPEICESQPYSFESDLWSLGVTLYKCLKNKFPFFAEDKNELKRIIISNYEPDYSNISSKLTRIIKGLLIRDPDKRLTLKKIIEYLKD